jgi:ADP-ribose pyrophosphatase YjhB (NUDIX family)
VAAAPWQIFKFCPRCGAARVSETERAAPFRCEACGFLYFFNPAVAVAVLILRDDGKALFIRRAKEPAMGRLALVGGFVDPGESAEQALRREVREEVQLELDQVQFLTSHPNDYRYEDTIYPVVDLVFVARATDHDRAVALDGVASFAWLDPRAVDLEELAFPSMRAALAQYRGSRRTGAR